MNILDVHTHKCHKDISQHIFSCLPSQFKPEEGGYYSVGIHPWNIDPDIQNEYNLLKEICNHLQIIAIGESGIDKTIQTDLATQEKVFRLHIGLSEQLKKPLIIHSVKATDEIVRLKKEMKPRSPWIIHGFRGKKELAEQLTKHDIYLSFGEKYQIEAISSIPLDRLLLETDESEHDILCIYESVSQRLSIPVEKLINQIRQNISRLFFSL
jgi:Mg-dependent DNase